MTELGPPPDVIETHISTVCFVGSRAYKLLKPVKTGFLDYSEVGQRLEAVDRELELNRRLAPDVYLGSADICEHGEVVDRMLIMRRLPHERRLSALVDHVDFESALRRVARSVATFHAGLEPRFEPTGMATGEGLARLWNQNFEQIESVAGKAIDQEEFEAVRSLATRYIAHHARLFDRRRELGMVRDGHGDLTAEDIFILDDSPRILDCLAFDDGLRVSDVLADIGFLVMDVHRLAGSDSARRLMRWYTEFSGEHHPGSLAHLYVAYRAHVRAKIEVIRLQQGVETAAESARAYHQLALDHLRRARLRVVLVGGGPGSGKTTLANAIADATGWVVLGSDDLRKDLCGVPHDVDRRDDPWTGMYDLATTNRTYEVLLGQAETALEMGEAVILDASWISERHREQARALARRLGADLVELECSVPAEVAKRRIATRRGASSDARPEIVDQMAARRDPWPTSHKIDSDRGLEESVGQAFDHMSSSCGSAESREEAIR